MICPECGTQNPDGALYCSLCLRRFGAQQSGMPQVPPPSKAPGPPLAEPAPPASDWTGRAAPIPAGPVSKKFDRPLWVQVVAFLFIVACSIGGFFAGWYLVGGGNTTFTSASSNISFSYPRKWKKINPQDLGASTMMGTSYMGFGYELMVADAKGEDLKSFLAEANSPISPPNDIASAKTAIQSEFSQQMSGYLPAGATMSTPVFVDLTVGGSPAFSTRFTLTVKGESYYCDMTFVQNGSTAYLLVYMGKSKDVQIPPEFQKVLDSVQFKGAPTSSSSAT